MSGELLVYAVDILSGQGAAELFLGYAVEVKGLSKAAALSGVRIGGGPGDIKLSALYESGGYVVKKHICRVLFHWARSGFLVGVAVGWRKTPPKTPPKWSFKVEDKALVFSALSPFWWRRQEINLFFFLPTSLIFSTLYFHFGVYNLQFAEVGGKKRALWRTFGGLLAVCSDTISKQQFPGRPSAFPYRLIFLIYRQLLGFGSLVDCMGFPLIYKKRLRRSHRRAGSIAVMKAGASLSLLLTNCFGSD